MSQAIITTSKVVKEPERPAPYTKAEQMVLVQRYRDFANGGARQADAQLALENTRLANEEKLKVADEEAFAALFGNETPESSPSKSSTVQRVSNMEGTFRFRYVQYYTGAPTKKDTEPSLLDL